MRERAPAASGAENARVAMHSARSFVRAERERNRRRLPIAQVPALGREVFRCERWACSLSRWACSLRWSAANDAEHAATEFVRCSSCAVGEDHTRRVRIAARGWGR